jgi:anti-sigma regulatory factor (Ser/Thr protein kinase)
LLSAGAAQREAAGLLQDVTRAAGNGISLSLAADVLAPVVARRSVTRVARDAGARQDVVDRARTVVSEAVNNVVLHAYEPACGPLGPVFVDAGVTGSDITIIVADCGRGPRVQSPNPGMGLGWKIIAQLVRRWGVIQRGGGGTLVYMCVGLSGTPRPGPVARP